MQQRVIPVSYQLFNSLSKYPFDLITRLQQMIGECRDPIYLKAIGCIVSSHQVIFSDEWSALYWESEVLKKVTQEYLVVALPSGPLNTVILQGHPLNFFLLLMRDRTMVNEEELIEDHGLPQVMLYEAGSPENRTILPGRVVDNSNTNYYYYLYPVVLDPVVSRSDNYHLVVHNRPGLRPPRFMLQKK